MDDFVVALTHAIKLSRISSFKLDVSTHENVESVGHFYPTVREALGSWYLVCKLSSGETDLRLRHINNRRGLDGCLKQLIREH